MFIVACSLAGMLLVIMLVQIVWANRFVNLYRNSRPIPDGTLFPHVGVIMSLRGADPFLEHSLRGLMTLDYPSHEVRIVVDSAVDPAYEVVQRVRNETGSVNVDVEILNVDQHTSSLKNSALVQGIASCSQECEAFAWLDSDTVPYPSWLKDLIAPLQHDDVGAACGIRWYAPQAHTIANYVRHIWNSAAVLQMVAFGIGWGGAFAICRAVYEDANLAAKWSRALVEDTLASNEILAQGKRVEFVAAATMPNPESATFTWCVNFVTRQLQGLRYYHSAWPTVLALGLFSGAVLVGVIVVSLLALAQADFASAGVGFGVLGLFGVVACWLMIRSEKQVIMHLRDRSIGTTSSPWRLIVAAPVAQVVHLLALVRAYVLSDVTWRGIRYEIRSGMDVTRLNYSPYEPEEQDSADSVVHSL